MRSAAIPIAHPLSLATAPDERTFFQALGARVAQARKDAGLTQVQLAERLGIPQPQLASYEVGRRRVPVSLLPRLARALAMPIETLIADDGPPPPAPRRGKVSRLQQQVEAISQLPKAKQKFVVEMLDTVLAQHAL